GRSGYSPACWNEWKPKICNKFTGKLKSQQNKAVNALLESSVGILEASTGFGKTVTALALVAKRKANTLILVHSRQLAEQWLERINVFLKDTEVGSLLGGKEKLSYQVDVVILKIFFVLFVTKFILLRG
ncbi:MAG: DEAD/DEAH box helicase family protein, partial [Alteromonas sp.]